MKKVCDYCGGTGNISFFQGVSRFLLTVEECPHCAGTGLQLEDSTSSPENQSVPNKKKTKTKIQKIIQKTSTKK